MIPHATTRPINLPSSLISNCGSKSHQLSIQALAAVSSTDISGALSHTIPPSTLTPAHPPETLEADLQPRLQPHSRN
ncbi:hypothetical protein SLA2020_472150 [Shorea laevis]